MGPQAEGRPKPFWTFNRLPWGSECCWRPAVAGPEDLGVDRACFSLKAVWGWLSPGLRPASRPEMRLAPVSVVRGGSPLAEHPGHLHPRCGRLWKALPFPIQMPPLPQVCTGHTHDNSLLQAHLRPGHRSVATLRGPRGSTPSEAGAGGAHKAWCFNAPGSSAPRPCPGGACREGNSCRPVLSVCVCGELLLLPCR